jgi:predicted nucleic-acid-binding Zn-ribbon protein
MSELKHRVSRTCPECGSANLRQTTTASAGAYGPVLLPGLGGFLHSAQLRVVVCADCGLTRFYADSKALAKLPTSGRWFAL